MKHVSFDRTMMISLAAFTVAIATSNGMPSMYPPGFVNEGGLVELSRERAFKVLSQLRKEEKLFMLNSKFSWNLYVDGRLSEISVQSDTSRIADYEVFVTNHKWVGAKWEDIPDNEIVLFVVWSSTYSPMVGLTKSGVNVLERTIK